jgi:hypothetical protein
VRLDKATATSGSPEQVSHALTLASAEPTWVLRALGWAKVGTDTPEEVRVEARHILEGEGLLALPFFMGTLDARLRPRRERAALAIIASLRLADAERSITERNPDALEKWQHLAQTARELLDLGNEGVVRAGVSAEPLVWLFVQLEARKKDMNRMFERVTPFRLLLQGLLEADAAGPGKLRQFVADASEVAGAGNCATLRYISASLGVEITPSKKGWRP